MTELKCPYCNKPLVDRGYYDYMCPDECDGAGNIVGNESMWNTLIATKKKLDICMKALNKIANTDIKVIEREPSYYARAMFSVTNNALGRIQEVKITMSKLICPFCGQELKYDSWNEVYMCRNPNCKHLLGFGTKELWQELICTRKALDVAVGALKLFCGDKVSYHITSKIDATHARKALKQINEIKGGKDE